VDIAWFPRVIFIAQWAVVVVVVVAAISFNMTTQNHKQRAANFPLSFRRRLLHTLRFRSSSLFISLTIIFIVSNIFSTIPTTRTLLSSSDLNISKHHQPPP
jgi:hypothetical protein